MKERRTLTAALRRSRSGVAAIEFALILPFMTIAGLYGTELTWFMLTNMKVSQVAMQAADNASRIGDTSTLENRAIFEADINDLLVGANLDGPGLELYQRGRVIISSVEVWNQSGNCANNGCPGGTATNGQQFIHWQRCRGLKNVSSSYGVQNAALPNGIGPVGQEVSAPADSAVMFVEIKYDYRPLVSTMFINNVTISAIASFLVRDSRDLTGIKQRNAGSPDPVASCNTFSAT